MEEAGSSSAAIKDANDGEHAGKTENHELPLQYVVMAAAAAVVLPLLYRLGPASSLLVVVFAVGISATPALRSVVDSILGKTAVGRHRLASQEVTPKLYQRPILDSSNRNPIDAEAYIPLDVGDALQPPLSRLIDLVQRDFIDFWYTSSVALSSDTPFPQHTRSLLNATFNNLVMRVKRQDPKEVSIYLFHSASNALITQVRENKEGRIHDAGLDLQEKQNLIRKVRRTSEELMLTLAPRSACTSPLVLSLLVEVLSLQIWSTIQSLNSDFINTTIVSSFGQAVNAVKEVQKDTQEAEAKRQWKTSVGSNGQDDGLESVLQTTENEKIIQLNPIRDLSRGGVADINKVVAGNGALPPPLPVRKAPTSTASSDPIPDANARKPPQTISLDSPDHTFAASGIPSYGMMGPTPIAYASSRKSLDAKAVDSSSAPTTSTSRPNSVPNSPRAIPARLEDRTIEEALDHGAAKLKAFGKGLFSAGQKLLDAAILPDDATATGHARQASEGATHSRRGSVQLPQSPRAPSLKGKERAIDLDDPADTAGSPVASSPSTSVKSPSMARDPSRKSVASFGSGFGSLVSPPSSRPSSVFGGGTAPPVAASAQLPARDKLQIAIDILKSRDTDRCAHLAKQLERSLFSKDLALLFPAPQDDQLRAILARHTSVEELVDPTMIGLSDEFHAYLERDASGTGERLLRLWTQLDHFGYMVEMTKPTLDQLYDDTLGLLQKTINQMDDIPFTTADAVAEERAYITACEMTMLRLQQNPNREIFEPLQDWLIKSIQEKYWDAFMKEKAGKEGIGMPRPPVMERVPSASTSRRTLDTIPNTLSSSPADDGDLGMSMRDEEEAHHRAVTTPGTSSHAAIAPAAPTGLTPSSSAASLPPTDEAQDPAFSITLTDLSPPSAYLNNHVKSRKDLEFLIAVEVEGSPGYILARKYIEFEKMDAGIKKALPQSGTKAFPRAPLPSTNFQTSDNLCRSLEHYLEALLHDDRYAASDPVTAFFAKERTDSKGRPVQPLAFLGRGVNNLGKGVADVTKGIGKGGEFAGKSLATGFNQFTSAVTTLPGLKRTTSSGPGDGSQAVAEAGSKRFSTSSTSLAANDEASLAAASKERLRSPSMASLSPTIAETDEAQPEDSIKKPTEEGETPKSTGAGVAPPPLPPRARSPEGYQVPEPSEEAAGAAVTTIAPEPDLPSTPVVAHEVLVPPPPGFNYTPRKKTGKSRPTSPTSHSIPLPDEPLPETAAQPISPTVRGRMSFDELLQQDKEALRKQTEDGDGLKPPSTEGGSRAPSPLNLPSMLSPVEFNNVLSFAMAILEEAYDLVDSTWNLKRGLLKVLETVLRTSYAGVIKAAVQKLVMMASDEASYGKRIDGLTDSFWPSPERIWWSSLPGAKGTPERTATEKEATRLEAKRLLLLQAPEGLKVTLGSAATADAFGRLHDALQGQGAERLVSSLVLDYIRLLLL